MHSYSHIEKKHVNFRTNLQKLVYGWCLTLEHKIHAEYGAGGEYVMKVLELLESLFKLLWGVNAEPWVDILNMEYW